jgi:hypothetical protein
MSIEKGKKYMQVSQDLVNFSTKAPKEKFPKRTQSAFYQLKLGKGLSKSFSKVIGKDADGQCFGDCRFIQTLKHLILYCKHYRKERKEMEKVVGSRMSIAKLFYSKRGREALHKFLHTTQIAIAKWLLSAGVLEEETSSSTSGKYLAALSPHDFW